MSSNSSPTTGTLVSALRRAAGLAVRLAAIALLAGPALAACSSIENSSIAHDLRAAESHNPPGTDWLPAQDRGRNGQPWGGCPDSYRGWC